VKRQIPIAADTVFDIGSNTKVFTAIAVMQLEERGKLNTSDSITKYFQNVPADKSGITIHHLLTHTSGFEREDFYDESPPEIREILKDREKYIERILSFPLAFKPGEKSLYSNSGFSFLAAIVEKISGQSYETYLRENVLKPAGMSNTGYVIPNWKNKRIARGYNDGDTDYGFPWDTQWSGKIIPWDLLANGGLLSTVDDMYKFIVALQGEKLLSKKTKDKMFTVYIPERGQAYGWIIPKAEQEKPIYITHGGDAEPQGWNADFRWYRDENLVAIVLTNKRVRAGSIRRRR
jgi:CubicO group peptidase (beta-lactamase class C family)